jgi:O-antigen/teichoic acid export membrane protein
MTLKRIISGGAVVAGGQGVAQALGLVRTVLVARALGPEHMGLGVLLGVVAALLEMVSSLGLDTYLIQSREGRRPRVQRTVQAIAAARGVLIAALLVALAGPVCGALGVGHAAPAMRVLALSPLLGGLAHMDSKRLQRRLRFAPDCWVEMGSQAAACAAAAPVLWVVRDYWAIVWLTVVKAAAAVVISHLVAERRYGWSMTPAAWRVLAFGLPLMANGVLLYAITQGDQLVVGSFAAASALGVYAAAAALAAAPVSLAARVASAVGLPILSACRGPREFRRRAGVMMAGLAGGAVILIGPLVVLPGAILRAGFGEGFAGGWAVLVVMAVGQGARMVRVAPVTAAVARGDTMAPLAANVVRACGLAGTVGAAAAGAPLWVLAACGMGGEFAALAASLVRAHRDLRAWDRQTRGMAQEKGRAGAEWAVAA